MKYEYIGSYRLVDTSCPESARTVFIQEKSANGWVYKLDSCGVPMQTNKIDYARAICEGRIYYGQTAKQEFRDGPFEPVPRKDIIKEVMRLLGVGYFMAMLLTYRHSNRWGFPQSAFSIAWNTLKDLGLEEYHPHRAARLTYANLAALKAMLLPKRKVKK